MLKDGLQVKTLLLGISQNNSLIFFHFVTFFPHTWFSEITQVIAESSWIN